MNGVCFSLKLLSIFVYQGIDNWKFPTPSWWSLQSFVYPVWPPQHRDVFFQKLQGAQHGYEAPLTTVQAVIA